MPDVSSFEALASLRKFGEAVPCRFCLRPVIFDKDIRNESGKMQALNLDYSLHRCWQNGKPPALDEESVVSSVINFVVEVNRRLSSCQLKIVREDAGV